MQFTILTDAERVALRSVATTSEQAQQIIDRHNAVLGVVEGRSRRTCHGERMIDIGCPHCMYSETGWFLCRSCAYPGVPNHQCQCLGYTFGGHFWQWPGAIALGADTIAVNLTVWKYYSTAQRRSCRRWLRGHIEWGMGVLDGTL